MEPDHVLDRPVWHALTTRQARLARGTARARRFAPAFGLFAAAADGSPESLDALAALTAESGPVALVEAREMPVPRATHAISSDPCCQMIAARLAPADPGFTAVALSEADAPQMLALATLTEPGPFFARTHELGSFVGVKLDGALVAMAGERMKPEGFTEVSGVCTHPAHRGQGYARGLTREVAARILARGEVPFLHVYAYRTAAIALYESLGFSVRRMVTMTVLARD